MAPRLPSATRKPRQAAARNPTGAPPANPAPGDNIKAMEEGERVQLISFIAKLDKADEEIEKTKLPFEAAKAAKASLIKLAAAAGFTKQELKDRREEMAAPTSSNVLKEERERRHRRWLGIVRPEQSKMHLEANTPAEARDAEDWKAEGYKAGLRGRAATLPDGMPNRYTQDFMQGHATGAAEYLATMAENVPKPKGVTAAQVAAQAQADYTADNPEVDVDEAARKLKANGFLNREGPVLGDDVDGEKKPGADDAFEATEEELAAQRTRTAITDAKDGKTSGEDAAVV